MKAAVARNAMASLGVSSAFLSLLSAGTALAQANIGSAVLIERDVAGTFAGQTHALTVGDGVVSNENIKTASASSAQLRFLDQTSLTIGPTSSVVLDRFIYNPDGSARAGTVEMAIGAARWVGGGTQPDEAYKIKTPHAVIGVRGTVFDLVVETRRTIVTLREGAIIVCLIHQPQRCVTVTAPGSMVVVTATEIRGPTPSAPSPTQFADNCLSPTDRRLSLCATETLSPSINRVAAIAPFGAPLSGFYAGVNFGYGVGNFNNGVAVAPFDQGDPPDPFSFTFPGGNSAATGRPGGIVGGIELGYVWRPTAGWLAGVATDFQASGQKSSALGQFAGTTSGLTGACSALTCTYTNTADITARLSWFGTARGRAGVELNGLWLYATGGLAYGQVSVSGANTFMVAASGFATPVVYATPINYSVTKVGWVGGAGIEGRLGLSPWTWKVEYLHVDLGSIGPYSFGSVPNLTIDSRMTDEIARIGLNYTLSN